jgi:hypothetical protein
LIRWSIQEVRRIAIRLARKRIRPAHIIAWSLWRRAHQAAAQRAHFKNDNCNARAFSVPMESERRLYLLFDAFSSCEPVSTSLENALAKRKKLTRFVHALAEARDQPQHPR